MNMKKLPVLMMSLMFLVVFCFNLGCSKENPKDPKSFMEKVRKAEKATQAEPKKAFEDPLREKHMAIANQCSERYESCLEKCAKKSNDKCDGKCIEDLSLCEKALPDDLKTMK
jgi:Tfp pilus assembly protein PilP